MADVLDRATLRIHRSVNTPDFPVALYVHNPDLSAVAGWDRVYWVLTGDTVTLMDSAARAAVDVATQGAQRDATADQLDGPEDVLRAFARAVLDELNRHAQRNADLLAAITNANNLSQLQSAAAAIPTIPQRTIADLKSAVRGKLGT